MQRLRFVLALAASLPLAAQPAPVKSAFDEFRASAIRAHTKFLSSDLLEGRGPGTRGDELATSYTAAQFEAMGLERVGTHGSTAALALLNDAVKKGGAMASSYVGGLSGAFLPVSEDAAMIDAANNNTAPPAPLPEVTKQ